MKSTQLAVVLAAALVAACSSSESDDHKRPDLRAALDASSITLLESVDVALAETTGGKAFEAVLLVDATPLFAVGAVDQAALKEFRISGATGQVVGSTPMNGTAPGACPGQITVGAALDIAAARANGDAVAFVPDDDVECAFEIQVLSTETLWEVKVAGDGEVLEYELSDEYL